MRAAIRRLEKSANRGDRRAAESIAKREHKRCNRGAGFLVNRKSHAHYPAPCRDWRRCASCARSYGIALSRRWSQVQGLRAFVVVTMPAEGGDWRIEENRRAMMRAWRRLYERLCRRFDRRPKLMHFKEHAGAGGRLHLNVLWDWEWIDQGELSLMAAECGFGPICWIRRADREVEVSAAVGSSAAMRYSMKTGFRPSNRASNYARKTGSQTAAAGDDWPKRVRRWGASRAASADMGPRPRNPDWYWLPIEPAPEAEPRPAEREIWLLPDDYLPHRVCVTPRPPPPAAPMQLRIEM